MPGTKAVIFALQFNRPPGADPEGPATASPRDLMVWADAPVIDQLRVLLEKSPARMKTQFSGPDPQGFFCEMGSVKFSSGSCINFGWSGTPGQIYAKPDGQPCTPGSVVWRIEGGTGIFDGVSGTITSNFVVDLDTHELIDNHVYILFLTE